MFHEIRVKRSEKINDLDFINIERRIGKKYNPDDPIRLKDIDIDKRIGSKKDSENDEIVLTYDDGQETKFNPDTPIIFRNMK